MAEEMRWCCKVLEAHLKVLGPDNLGTLDSMFDGAHVLMRSGKRKEAIAMMTECVERTAEVMGTKHPKIRPQDEEFGGVAARRRKLACLMKTPGARRTLLWRHKSSALDHTYLRL